MLKMSETRQKVKAHLEQRFQNVKENDNGFRFNVPQLDREDLFHLDTMPAVFQDILIKRSGTGVVVIIS